MDTSVHTPIKVLMFGWELPPFYAGGVGMVCYEFLKAFAKRGDVDVTYIMPYGPMQVQNPYARLLIANNLIANNQIPQIRVHKIHTLIGAYMSPEEYTQQLAFESQKSSLQSCDSSTILNKDNTKTLYGANLIEEVYRFAEKSRMITAHEDIDVIHAHDWTTFPAAIAAKEVSGAPLIVHIHITEFNKSGGAGVNPQIYAIEQEGMIKADSVVVVSNLMKQLCIEKYGIPQEKIVVIHNANIEMDIKITGNDSPFKDRYKVVLYAGRVTLQKGPEYFVEAARKICTIRDDVKFIMAGTGEMLQPMINRVAAYGLSDKFIFHGFYNREDAERFFAMADVFVLPSVSEPFGVTPLEAMMKKTPSVISKQSGVAEVLNHTLKVDFWDIDELAHKILALLTYPALHSTIVEHGYEEVIHLTWDAPAAKCVKLYTELIERSRAMPVPLSYGAHHYRGYHG